MKCMWTCNCVFGFILGAHLAPFTGSYNRLPSDCSGRQTAMLDFEFILCLMFCFGFSTHISEAHVRTTQHNTANQTSYIFHCRNFRNEFSPCTLLWPPPWKTLWLWLWPQLMLSALEGAYLIPLRDYMHCIHRLGLQLQMKNWFIIYSFCLYVLYICVEWKGRRGFFVLFCFLS